MEAPSVESLLTVGGLGLVVTIITEIIWKAANVASDVKERIGPLVSVVVGCILAVLASFTLGLTGGQDIGTALLTGVFAGATGIGIHDAVSSAAPNLT